MMHFSEMHSSAHLAHLVETLVAHFKADISEDQNTKLDTGFKPRYTQPQTTPTAGSKPRWKSSLDHSGPNF